MSVTKYRLKLQHIQINPRRHIGVNQIWDHIDKNDLINNMDNKEGTEDVKEYFNELRKNLEEAENLIQEKENNIKNIKAAIISEAEQLIKCFQKLSAEEQKCIQLGKNVHGPNYILPQ